MDRMGTDASLGLSGRVVVLNGSRLAGRKDWQELADVVVLTCAAQRPSGLLLDVRSALFVPTAREADRLASALSGCPCSAIVTGGDASFGCARMVATSLELRGRTAAAFHDEVGAWAWLEEALGRPDPPQRTRQARGPAVR